uniref:Uncharacterized protein n=1 Tax=Rhodopseudomonas palustris (strain DX-1) TaxID=652103 RepID=E6VFL4_RHOPX
MTKITIHKLHSGFANIADDWSLSDVPADEYRGDYAAVAELPKGFRVARSMGGNLAVYDATDNHYEVTADAGAPVLAGNGTIIPLELVR